MSQIILGSLFHLLQNHCRDFLRGIETSVDVYTRSIVVTLYYFIRHTADFFLYLVPVFAHETFDGENRTGGVRDSLTLGRITDFTFATINKCYY